MRYILIILLAVSTVYADDILDIGVNIRHRLELRDNFDFNDDIDDEDAFHLIRTRINIAFDPVEIFHIYMQLQDSRILDGEFSNNTPFRDNVDIRQLYLDINIPESPFTLRAGRQELIYGDERLIGGFNWSNVAQSFDGVRLIHELDEIRTDIFWVRKVVIDTDSFNEWDKDDDILGIYSTYKGIDRHILELYYLFRATDRDIGFGPDVGLGELDESTIGFRIKGKDIDRFDYEIESAFQFGDFSEKDINAFAIIIVGGYTFDLPWSPRLGVEWDHASGDESPDDNRRNTFDNLFPTNHKHYGYMDRVSLQNINNMRFQLSASPQNNLYLQTDLHLIYLDENTDSLYNAGRNVIRTALNSDISKYVGTEMDLLARYIVNKNFRILIGYSHFFSGKFLKNTGPHSDGDFFYLETTLNF